MTPRIDIQYVVDVDADLWRNVRVVAGIYILVRWGPGSYHNQVQQTTKEFGYPFSRAIDLGPASPRRY